MIGQPLQGSVQWLSPVFNKLTLLYAFYWSNAFFYVHLKLALKLMNVHTGLNIYRFKLVASNKIYHIITYVHNYGVSL